MTAHATIVLVCVVAIGAFCFYVGFLCGRIGLRSDLRSIPEDARRETF